jgi:glycerol-3-phosphate O-acyltransferase / dihydroxyacetone phosphate acyltransferase
MQLLMNVVDRPISFIAAAKSCRRALVGAGLRATGAIPVERPQDIAFKGEGKITAVNGKFVTGQGTAFSKLTKGCTLELSNKEELLVAEIINDEEIRTTSEVGGFANQEHSYKVMPKMEYNDLYAKVW